MIKTDIIIIGAGPTGLFTVFEAGLLKLKCHLIDALAQPGGQCSEIYPKKPIYDIPAYPEILAGDLTDKLLEQIKQFEPGFTLGERAEEIIKDKKGVFTVTTNKGTKHQAPVVAIAGGLGSFEPRKPQLENLEKFEDNGIEYIIKDPEIYRNKKVVIAGGGDSALDWSIFLANINADITLVHRRNEFRGALDSVEKVRELKNQNKINIITPAEIIKLNGDEKLNSVTISHINNEQEIKVDHFIPLFGLSPKLGPIANWGLEIEKNAIKVDTFDYQTNINGIFAIGDVNTYPGKLKLILCGFHEATLMCQSAMYGGDKSRKYNLVEHGFRLPAAMDNRPLKFEEFEIINNQTIYVSATPADYELEKCDGVIVEQIIRPTGLLEPKIIIKPSKNQIDDLIEEIRLRVVKKERVLVTTLTKKMAEELTKYLGRISINCRYIHSDVDTIERVEILHGLREGQFDVLIGVNLLREGLDLPEVSLVAIMDADKEGFLRSERSLIQTSGRAARNVDGCVIMYADKVTKSMKNTIDQTNYKREKQKKYNKINNIKPTPIIKKTENSITEKLNPYKINKVADFNNEIDYNKASVKELDQMIKKTKNEMQKMAKSLHFIEAGKLRDKLFKLEEIKRQKKTD